MKFERYLERGVGKYRRTAARYLYRKKIKLENENSKISFTFDDVPRTAIIHGGEILNKYGAYGTFYVSLGKLESDSPSGQIASLTDLIYALKEGHELGCHTFDHMNSWETKTEIFVKSVLMNSKALSDLIPKAHFSSFAYPICDPRPETKREVGKIFECSRGGGEQTFNVGETDLNLLKAFFLDIRTGATIDAVKQIIDKCAEERGWLIFATHDIDDDPSRYGCPRKMFTEIVKYATQSGANLLPVGKVCEKIIFKM